MKVYLLTSAKFEELYIEDWIDYHLANGVDKVIINDNNPKDYKYQLKDILKKYIDNGIVIVERYYDSDEYKSGIDEYKNFTGKHEDDILGVIYTWLYNKYKSEFDWAIKIDVDEYLVIPETNNDIKKFLSQEKFNDFKQIALNWITYGPAYQEYYSPEPVYERFKDITFIYHEWFKCIVRTSDDFIWMTHHLAAHEAEDICLANGLSVKDGLEKNIVELAHKDWGISSLQTTNGVYALKSLKTAYLAHYRFLTNEEIAFKDEKFNRRQPGQKYRNLYNIRLMYLQNNKGKKRKLMNEIS